MKLSEQSVEGISNYGLYIYEREGKFIVEDARGYATYVYLQDCVYIEDIFVHPSFRRLGAGSEFTDKVVEMAKAKGFSKLLGTCKPRTKGSTESLKAQLAYGMRIDSCDNELIYLTKEI